MKAAIGTGPVAYESISIREYLVGPEKYTVIASESCFASGVDHCLVSEDDHLMVEHGGLYLQRKAPRRRFRA
jgi:hypothetical protein